MTMSEIVEQISFDLGIPANANVEDLQIEKAVMIAFRELKRYIKNPVSKTVPFSNRVDLKKVGIDTVLVTGVKPAAPRRGVTTSLGNTDIGDTFLLAAATNTYGSFYNSTSSYMEPVIAELAMTQISNILATDFQWQHDVDNEVVYVTHRNPYPPYLTIRYVPNYHDPSEIKSNVWIDYLIRLSEAHMKIALGRSRSKYKVEGSNVSLDGEILLDEANAELDKIREELAKKRTNMVVLN